MTGYCAPRNTTSGTRIPVPLSGTFPLVLRAGDNSTKADVSATISWGDDPAPYGPYDGNLRNGTEVANELFDDLDGQGKGLVRPLALSPSLAIARSTSSREPCSTIATRRTSRTSCSTSKAAKSPRVRSARSCASTSSPSRPSSLCSTRLTLGETAASTTTSRTARPGRSARTSSLSRTTRRRRSTAPARARAQRTEHRRRAASSQLSACSWHCRLPRPGQPRCAEVRARGLEVNFARSLLVDSSPFRACIVGATSFMCRR